MKSTIQWYYETIFKTVRADNEVNEKDLCL